MMAYVFPSKVCANPLSRSRVSRSTLHREGQGKSNQVFDGPNVSPPLGPQSAPLLASTARFFVFPIASTPASRPATRVILLKILHLTSLYHLN